MMTTMAVCLTILCGCNELRFAPGEAQKQNAWLHQQTTQAVAQLAQTDPDAPLLKELANAGVRQSQVFLSYTGMPETPVTINGIEDLISDQSTTWTQQALEDALQRPDAWDMADGLLETSLAIAGIIGGVWGTRAVGLLGTLRQKSQALHEVVMANESFKHDRPDSAAAFKQAQAAVQSTQTQAVVGAIRKSAS